MKLRHYHNESADEAKVTYQLTICRHVHARVLDYSEPKEGERNKDSLTNKKRRKSSRSALRRVTRRR